MTIFNQNFSFGFAMVFFALIIFIVLYFSSRKRNKEITSKNPYNNKLYTIYKGNNEFILINHEDNDHKITFKTIEELTNYLNINKKN